MNIIRFNIYFHWKVYNKRVIDIVISSKNQDSLLLQMDQTRASHLFDPDRDSSESSFPDLITISGKRLLMNQIYQNMTSCTNIFKYDVMYIYVIYKYIKIWCIVLIYQNMTSCTNIFKYNVTYTHVIYKYIKKWCHVLIYQNMMSCTNISKTYVLIYQNMMLCTNTCIPKYDIIY